MNRIKIGAVGAAAFATLTLLSACGSESRETPEAQATREESATTLAGALKSSSDLGKLQSVLAKSELIGVFDGPGSYTLLAPTDAAFAALGDKGDALLGEDQRPILIGILRNHMLPGHVRPEQIAEAIKAKGGPVTMATLGEGQVTFAEEGGTLAATLADGTSAALTGTPIATSNGVVIPVNALLLPGEDG